MGLSGAGKGLQLYNNDFSSRVVGTHILIVVLFLLFVCLKIFYFCKGWLRLDSLLKALQIRLITNNLNLSSTSPLFSILSLRTY